MLCADGEHIAIASHDGNIYVHAVYDEGLAYRRVGCCSVSSISCLQVDLSLMFGIYFCAFLPMHRDTMNPSCFWIGLLMDASFKAYPRIMSTLSVSASLSLCQRGLLLTSKTL